MIKRLEDSALYMNPFTGSIGTGESWEADFETAVRAGHAEELGWSTNWRDSMVQVDATGQEIE